MHSTLAFNPRDCATQIDAFRKGGLYHLLLHLKMKRGLQVGSLGQFTFPEGFYIYTGSAKRGLAKRIERHLQGRKKKHWHIDFLTTVAQVEQVLIDRSRLSTECQRHHAIMNLRGAETIVPRFGSSDCRCRSHLAYFKSRPRLNILQRSDLS